VPMTEEDLAGRLARDGYKVISAHGRLWVQTAPGLYDGIHWLARHTPAEARKPTTLCWGYRAALHDSEASSANGALPLHVITDLDDYDAAHAHRRTRKELSRFGRSGVRIVWVDSPDLLVSQGYEVMLSWIARTRHRAPASRASYLETVARHANDRSRLIFAGVQGTKLLGYQTSWVVDGTAYISELHLATEALPLHLSTALYFETVQAYRRMGVAREICTGLAMPEKEGLGEYKIRLGFQLVRVPARVWLLPLLSSYVKRRYPAKYYRFTGRGALPEVSEVEE
jgi:hypothetical protein